MVAAEVPAYDEPDSPLLSPWPLLVAGLVALGGAWAWAQALGDTGVPFRVLLICAGLVAVGSALALHIPHAGRGTEARLMSAGALLLSAFAVEGGRLALPADWGSIALALNVLAAVCLAGSLLIALPWKATVAVLSGLLLVHFAGILTAVVCVAPPPSPSTPPAIQAAQPPASQAPWIGLQAMTRIYGPYLGFLHINNGYHFYAPEPGPVTQLWFRVEYADGKSRWRRLPDHAQARNGLEKRRWGALATNTGQTLSGPPIVPPPVLQRLQAEEQTSGKGRVINTYWDVLVSRRSDAPIPLGAMPLPQQYREPVVQARLLLASLARYAARNTEHPDGADQPVKAVKAYRIDYHNAPPEAIAEGLDFRDPTLYQAFYQGEFDADGRIKEDCFRLIHDLNGNLIGRYQDPLLYWLIPIVRVPKVDARPPAAEDTPRRQAPSPDDFQLMNYLRIHAGDKGETSNP